MRSNIRNIGNSKGIIIPQGFLKECLIEEEVNIEVRDKHIIISPVDDQKRIGWADAFKEMAKNGDDQLLLPGMFDDEDITDWKW